MATKRSVPALLLVMVPVQAVLAAVNPPIEELFYAGFNGEAQQHTDGVVNHERDGRFGGTATLDCDNPMLRFSRGAFSGNPKADDVSVEFQLRFDARSAATTAVVARGLSGLGVLTISPTRIRLHHGNQQIDFPWQPDATWHHVQVFVENDSARVRVNGTNIKSSVSRFSREDHIDAPGAGLSFALESESCAEVRVDEVSVVRGVRGPWQTSVERFLFWGWGIGQPTSLADNLFDYAALHDFTIYLHPGHTLNLKDNRNIADVAGYAKSLRAFTERAARSGIPVWLELSEAGGDADDHLFDDPESTTSKLWSDGIRKIVDAYAAGMEAGGSEFCRITVFDEAIYNNHDAVANPDRAFWSNRHDYKLVPPIYMLFENAIRDVVPDCEVGLFLSQTGWQETRTAVEVLDTLRRSGYSPDFNFVDRFQHPHDQQHRTRYTIRNAIRLNPKPTYFWSPLHTGPDGYTPAIDELNGLLASARLERVTGFGWYHSNQAGSDTALSPNALEPNPAVTVDMDRYVYFGARDRWEYGHALAGNDTAGDVSPSATLWLQIDGADHGEFDVLVRNRVSGGWDRLLNVSPRTDKPEINGEKKPRRVEVVALRELPLDRYLHNGEIRFTLHSRSDDAEARLVGHAVTHSAITPLFDTEASAEACFGDTIEPVNQAVGVGASRLFSSFFETDKAFASCLVEKR